MSGTIAQQTAEYSEIDNLILKVDASSTKAGLQTQATKSQKDRSLKTKAVIKDES